MKRGTLEEGWIYIIPTTCYISETFLKLEKGNMEVYLDEVQRKRGEKVGKRFELRELING